MLVDLKRRSKSNMWTLSYSEKSLRLAEGGQKRASFSLTNSEDSQRINFGSIFRLTPFRFLFSDDCKILDEERFERLH